MPRWCYLFFAFSLGTAPGSWAEEPKMPDEKPVTAVVETTLRTAAGHIRQFAFDGDANTYFASEQNPRRTDHFTLAFDRPVALKSIAITTGRPDGTDSLDAGRIEVSEDGKAFASLATFAAGKIKAQANGRKVRAVRVQPADDLKHPLAIREIAIDSQPPVAIFKYPVEFTVDVSDAPDMREWAEKAAHICERAYPMINEELKVDDYKPATMVRMTLRSNYRGVAATGGTRITGSATFFKQHPDDFGAMVHETVHVVQNYRVRGNPSWLVEGVADYIRFFKYEPGKLRPLNPARARYNGSYQVTARFLAYVTEKHDKELVRKLNQAMRAGQYKEDLFKEWTGKTVQELGEEWKASLGKPANALMPARSVVRLRSR